MTGGSVIDRLIGVDMNAAQAGTLAEWLENTKLGEGDVVRVAGTSTLIYAGVLGKGGVSIAEDGTAETLDPE